MIPPCLTLSNIRYVSRVKRSYPGKRVAPSPTPRCSRYWKGSLLVALDYDRQQQLVFQKGYDDSSHYGCHFLKQRRNYASVFISFRFGFFVLWHINLRELLNAKAILREERECDNLIHSWEDKGWGFIPFSRGICLKVNVIAQLEFELAYYNSRSPAL